ncbi:MAG: L-lactate dehydrogenase [Longimicrobiales bacterium]|nr:L-lactate dehydrogenase [Longimicrobiales bacterium]
MGTLRLAPASTDDYRRLAERRLPRFLYDYIAGGAYDEVTMAANVDDLRALELRQRVMRDVSAIDTEVEVLGERWAMPLALAPVGMAGMMRRRAEAQAVRVADALGLPFCLSTVGICSVEEVARAARRPFWFQLYMMRDRGHVKELVGRAAAAGCRTLVLTVDLAVVGARYRDVRNGLSGGTSAWGRLRGRWGEILGHPRWAWDVGVRGRPHLFGNLIDYVPDASSPEDFRGWVNAQFDPSVTWDEIAWLREIWAGPIVVKGVLTPEDAVAAADAGADAVIVSNHGGRQLDGVSSAIRMLPRVVDAAGERLDVLLDSGVRSGQDVLRALALGAKAVLIGRPWIWAMAARGAPGLRALLETFHAELKTTMQLTGCTAIADVTPDVLEGGGR